MTLVEKLKKRREQSIKRRIQLAQLFKLKDPRKLESFCRSKEEIEERRQYFREISRVYNNRPKKGTTYESLILSRQQSNAEPTDATEETDKEKVYTDSSAFLKGTQSANPHNDYCQHFVDTGERPQNFIRDVGLTNRFEEYPKLRELILKKDLLIQQTNTPPMYYKCDLETFDLRDLDCKFDVILLEPPLEEYQRTLGVTYDKFWRWEEIEKLAIDQIAAPRSFIWIWCGSSDGLDAGRRCLKKWGYRRCEDICWIKTNIDYPGHKKNLETKAIFQRTKEHCLMGIKGTVRRSTDGDFIHANVDIDLVIEEEPRDVPDEKPLEIFHIIEHFCLGRRRLHLFGKDTSVRPGWLTIGPRLTTSNFDPEVYAGYFVQKADGHLTGCSEEIERLRPKSPPPKNSGGQQQQQQQMSSNNMMAAAANMGPVAQGMGQVTALTPSAMGIMTGGVVQVAGMPVFPRDIVAGATAMLRNSIVAAAQQQLAPRLAPPPRSLAPPPRNVIPSPHHLIRLEQWQTRPGQQPQRAVGVAGRPWLQAMPGPR